MGPLTVAEGVMQDGIGRLLTLIYERFQPNRVSEVPSQMRKYHRQEVKLLHCALAKYVANDHPRAVGEARSYDQQKADYRYLLQELYAFLMVDEPQIELPSLEKCTGSVALRNSFLACVWRALTNELQMREVREHRKLWGVA